MKRAQRYHHRPLRRPEQREQGGKSSLYTMTLSSKPAEPADRGTYCSGSSRVFLALIFLASGATLLAADTAYCAFEVQVIKPSGGPASKVAVGIVEGGRELTETLTDARGRARFCDAPLRPVDVFVGFASCGLVTAKQVRPLWLRTRRVLIIYDGSYCKEFGPFPTRCRILLRINDDSGRPLAGARFTEATPRNDQVSAPSDIFGRLFRVVEAEGMLEGSVTKEGYGSAPVSQTCLLREEEADREVKVVLHK
jgi:hypothetical protein